MIMLPQQGGRESCHSLKLFSTEVLSCIVINNTMYAICCIICVRLKAAQGILTACFASVHVLILGISRIIAHKTAPQACHLAAKKRIFRRYSA